MSKVTEIQKQVLIDLASQFYPKCSTIFIRGSRNDVTLNSEKECAVVKSFMDMIVDAVNEKYPDNEDLNNDAILAVFLGSRFLNDFVISQRS